MSNPIVRGSPRVLAEWLPEDEGFWTGAGQTLARRNLWISIPALFLAFAVWMVWSAVVVNLPKVGFTYDADQLFWLAALPGLSGATLRIFYSFMVPIFGGRRWTAISTALLLIPALGIGVAVQDPSTPYVVLLVLALSCGLGGGNFASSMANISHFFPRREKGKALALNAGLGNLGVSAVQLVVPLIITVGVFGALGGGSQALPNGARIWLQNAGFIWVPFIVVSAVAAWFGMHDIASVKASVADQTVIFKRRHTWIMCLLYTGTFGSFIGYSAGLPLLMGHQFPDVNPLQYAFLGPLVGSLARSASGGLADRVGGGRVTLWVFVTLAAGVCLLLYFLELGQSQAGFWGFFITFLVLFAATGVGNASTFQMIPVIFRIDRTRFYEAREGPPPPAATIQLEAGREAAAVIGFTSAIAAYGAFFIPKSYGSAIALTGGPQAALIGFLLFYVVCIIVTWMEYAGPRAETRC